MTVREREIMKMPRREFLKTGLAGSAMLLSPSALAAIGMADKTVFIGATAYACGYALAHPESVVIVERWICPAPEFVLTLDPEEAGTPRMEISRQLAAEMKTERLLEGNKLYHQPFGDYLTDFLVRHGVKILFNAEFVRTEKLGDGWRVVLSGADGLISCKAARIVYDHPGASVAITGVIVKSGKGSETRLFRVPVAADAGPEMARLALATAWEREASKLPGWDLVAEAGMIKTECRYADFFSALDAGLGISE